jgi:hypothetical protein
MLQKNKEKLSRIYTQIRENTEKIIADKFLYHTVIELGIKYAKEKALRTVKENSGVGDKMGIIHCSTR